MCYIIYIQRNLIALQQIKHRAKHTYTHGIYPTHIYAISNLLPYDISITIPIFNISHKLINVFNIKKWSIIQTTNGVRKFDNDSLDNIKCNILSKLMKKKKQKLPRWD